MAKKTQPGTGKTRNTADIGFEKQIWDAACVLWGHIPASEYRNVIIGLIFLKYISAAFEKKYNQLVREGDGFENDPDAYLEENVFFVPEAARWAKIAAAAHKPEIGTVIDDAMRAIEAGNKKLKGVLPKNYAGPDLDKQVLGDVVDLFTNMDMSGTEGNRDLLGRTYEYCIAKFAEKEETPRQFPCLRPLLRFRGNVCPVRPVHRRPFRQKRLRFHLRPGSQSRHLENGGHESDNPGTGRRFGFLPRRHLYQRPPQNLKG